MISLIFVFEPYRIPNKYAEETFDSDSRNLFYIDNQDGTYDLYLDNNYYRTEPKISDPDLPVYDAFPN